MKDLIGLIGREALVEKIVKEVKKGRHIILTGPVGCGKSAVLEAVLEQLEHRKNERLKVNAEDDALPGEEERQAARQLFGDKRTSRNFTLAYVTDHQAKGQFIAIARRLLQAGILKPEVLDLPEKFHGMAGEQIAWAQVKRHVTRLSMRDLTGAIIPAIHAHPGRILVAVDDLTSLTPTLQAFWLAVFEVTQVIGCASQKKTNLRKLWWKMTEIELPPLPPEAVREIVQQYAIQQAMLIESPDLFIEHVVKQANGNPQAIADMLEDASKERVVRKAKIREMQHAAGVRYVDFTPVMVVAGALIVGTRYVAMGLGDTALYVFAGLGAAIFMAVRYFLFRGAGKAN
ncbi:MAG TPA: ATP-binding protein [Candidatus Competibacteraceae bacterium]|nr:ATP-binding protein [Candidatus Competibacteraceae bacterium]